jgi:hypothetical protein
MVLRFGGRLLYLVVNDFDFFPDVIAFALSPLREQIQ